MLWLFVITDAKSYLAALLHSDRISPAVRWNLHPFLLGCLHTLHDDNRRLGLDCGPGSELAPTAATNNNIVTIRRA